MHLRDTNRTATLGDTKLGHTEQLSSNRKRVAVPSVANERLRNQKVCIQCLGSEGGTGRNGAGRVCETICLESLCQADAWACAEEWQMHQQARQILAAQQRLFVVPAVHISRVRRKHEGPRKAIRGTRTPQHAAGAACAQSRQ